MKTQKRKSKGPGKDLSISKEHFATGKLDQKRFYTDSQIRVLVGDIFDHMHEGYAGIASEKIASSTGSFTLSAILTFITADFKEAFGFKAETIQAIFVVITVMAGIAFVISLAHACLQSKDKRERRIRTNVVGWGTEHMIEQCTDTVSVSHETEFIDIDLDDDK